MPYKSPIARKKWLDANRDKKLAQNKRYYARTKETQAAQAKAKYWANPEPKREYSRRRQFKYRFGVPEATRDEMLAAQGGVCAICETPQPGRGGWNFDHCHASGVHRGVLCGRCNRGLGLFDDDVKRLAGAIAYLRRAETTMKPKPVK